MGIDLITIVQTIFIQPLQFVFEVIFSIANKLTGHPGLSIIVLSLIMNFLVLPLYKRADDMQDKQREKEEKLKKGIEHIKKSFSGDERMMILQTYYRQNNYKPTDALNGSISLLLEVPFFIAAYQFLSHLALLEGVSLGPISNLGQADAMFVIGGMTINVLPVVMTLVNIVSSAIYLKGFPLKTKVQLYAMAIFFLVFLYESPAGLVFYWTLNNVFSLFKNIFYKLKNPKKVLINIATMLGIAILGFVFFIYETNVLKRKLFLGVIGVLLLLPFVVSKINLKKFNKNNKQIQSKYTNVLLAGLIITMFVGGYIPSSIIGASPEEFVSIIYFHNPVNYIIYSLCMAFGFFVVWVGVFYWISNEKFKLIIEKLMIMCSFIFIVNYMFFGTELGNLLPNLKYELGLNFTIKEMALNAIVVLFVGIVTLFVTRLAHKQIPSILCVIFLAFSILSSSNIRNISTAIDAFEEKAENLINAGPHFNLSKEGQNVVVIMLDRAMNSHVPYIFNEKPELKEQFAGFTHYANTTSYGTSTNFCVPTVFGGYEYTPIKMNERKDELLVDKHNEALKVLPVLYSQNDYNVTLFDPSYANYSWIPDLSIYDEYPEIETYITEGRYNSATVEENNVEKNYRNFFCFSLMKSLPVVVQEGIYDYGYYHRLETVKEPTIDTNENEEVIEYNGQKILSLTQAEGVDSAFTKGYYVLQNLMQLTQIKDDASNNLFMMCNNTTHEPILLQAPEYKPSMVVDNTEYLEQIKDKYTIDGVTLNMDDIQQVVHYHANMAAMIQIGNWLDFLRFNGVYDNTKIILVADHGKALYQINDMIHDDVDRSKNVEFYYPLLMVKDFNADEFSVSYEFMTNADVPTIVTKDTIDNPINPFTGNKINNTDKYDNPIYVSRSLEWDTGINNGYTYLPSKWVIVKDDVKVESNWTYIEKECVDPR